MLEINTATYTGPERRTELREWKDQVDKRLHDGSAIMANLQSDLAENTRATKKIQEDTSELVGMFQNFKGAFDVLDKIGKLARPVGYIAMACSAVWGVFTAIKGGGK